MTGDDRRRVLDQRRRILPGKGRRRGDDIGAEADLRRLRQRGEMGLGGILDGQPAIEELVGLDVRAGQVAMGVVVLGEEAPGAQDDHRQAVGAAVEAAEMLGGELGRAVDVARLERRKVFVEPEGAAGAARLAGANRLGDHQRGGRGEDEAADAGRARRLEQVQRAGDVDVDEGLGRIADDVGLVQRAGMDDGVDRLLLEQPLDEQPLGDRADHLRISRPARRRGRSPHGLPA